MTEIVGVATLPAYRRRGIGAALTAALADDAVRLGVGLIFLSAAGDDVAAIYERLGFRRVGFACEARPPGVIVSCEALSKTFSGGIEAVRSVSFEVAEGEAYGLLGPNGAGKTTTIRMLGTLLRPTSGTGGRRRARRGPRARRGAPLDRRRAAGGGSRPLLHRAASTSR